MDARLRRVNKEIAGTYTLELEATIAWIDDMRGLALQIARMTRHPTSRST